MVGDHDSSDDREVMRQQGRRWMVRLSSGAATVDDARALEAWRAEHPDHDQAFREAARLWEQSGEALETHRAGATRRVVRLDRRALLVGGGAAAAAAALAVHSPPFDLWPSFASLNADYRTAPGERRRVTLATGLDAELNTRTALDRTRADGLGVRLIQGEAVFTADLRQEAFQVVAGAATVKASVAEVALTLLDDAGTASCLAGSASVDCLGQTVALAAGESVKFSGAGLDAIQRIDPAAAAAWRTGLLMFRGEALSDVVAELNRYRQAPIVLANRDLGRRRVSGVFHVGRLDEVIDHIQNVYGVNVRRMPGGVVLMS